MADVIIKKTEKLSGEVCAPPSKSYTQRMLIADALSNGTSKISNPLLSEDTEATFRAVTALGVEVILEEECWTVTGAVPLKNTEVSAHPVLPPGAGPGLLQWRYGRAYMPRMPAA